MISNFNILGVKAAGHKLEHENFFDTIKIIPKTSAADIKKRAEQKRINFRYFDDNTVSLLGISKIFIQFNCITKEYLHNLVP